MLLTTELQSPWRKSWKSHKHGHIQSYFQQCYWNMSPRDAVRQSSGWWWRPYTIIQIRPFVASVEFSCMQKIRVPRGPTEASISHLQKMWSACVLCWLLRLIPPAHHGEDTNTDRARQPSQTRLRHGYLTWSSACLSVQSCNSGHAFPLRRRPVQRTGSDLYVVLTTLADISMLVCGKSYRSRAGRVILKAQF